MGQDMSFPELSLLAAYASQQSSASGAYALRGASRWATFERLRHIISIDKGTVLDGSLKKGLDSCYRHYHYPATMTQQRRRFRDQSVNLANWHH